MTTLCTLSMVKWIVEGTILMLNFIIMLLNFRSCTCSIFVLERRLMIVLVWNYIRC